MSQFRVTELNMEEFWHAQAEWSQATFGLDNDRGPLGPLKHLQKEVVEALANPTDIMEYADCVFLVFDACRRAGFTYQELMSTINSKLAINRARKWNIAGDGEPSEHVRD